MKFRQNVLRDSKRHYSEAVFIAIEGLGAKSICCINAPNAAKDQYKSC